MILTFYFDVLEQQTLPPSAVDPKMCRPVLAIQPQAHLHAGGEEPTAHLKPTMCLPVLAIETGQSFVQSQTQGQEPAAL